MRLSELIAPAFYGVHADMRAGRHEEYFLKGGRGSAKSSFAAIELLLHLLRHPEENAMDAVERAFRCAVQRGVEARMRGGAPAAGRREAVSQESDEDYYRARYASGRVN